MTWTSTCRAPVTSRSRKTTREAVSVVRVHEPNPTNTQHYLARYAEYQQLIHVMHEPWETLNRLS